MKSHFFLKKIFLPVISFTILFSSCEKVVMVDVNNANQQVVVQGDVTDQPGSYTVKLNSSTAYYNSNVFPPVTGAQVIISDDAGNGEILKESTQGVYNTISLKGIPGRKYTLQISANGSAYSGASVMPLHVKMDTVVFSETTTNSKNKNSGNSSKQYRVTCKFKDPSGLGNYYRVVINSNNLTGLGDTPSRIVADKLIDGQAVSITLRTSFVSGDTVFAQLQCIDKATYDFYTTIKGAQGSASPGQFLGSLPANPTNNITNKGLGYFSAYALATYTIVVP